MAATANQFGSTPTGFTQSVRSIKRGSWFPIASFCGTDGLSPYGFSITNPGAGYTAVPAVTFAGGAGANAAATAILANPASYTAGTIPGIILTNPGSGYTSAPTVTIAAGASTTLATATCALDTHVALSATGPVQTAYGMSAVGNGGGFDVSSYETATFYISLLTMAATSFTFKVQLSDDNGLTWYDAPADFYSSGSAPAAITAAGKQIFGVKTMLNGFARIFTTISGTGATQGYINAQFH